MINLQQRSNKFIWKADRTECHTKVLQTLHYFGCQDIFLVICCCNKCQWCIILKPQTDFSSTFLVSYYLPNNYFAWMNEYINTTDFTPINPIWTVNPIWTDKIRMPPTISIDQHVIDSIEASWKRYWNRYEAVLKSLYWNDDCGGWDTDKIIASVASALEKKARLYEEKSYCTSAEKAIVDIFKCQDIIAHTYLVQFQPVGKTVWVHEEFMLYSDLRDPKAKTARLLISRSVEKSS